MLEPRSSGADVHRLPYPSIAPLMSSARLLLIDDDARLTGMVGDYLRAAGFEVSTAGSLAQAREALSHARFELLVLDLMLPDGDGLDFCRWLRGDPRWRHQPVLMLSARGEPMDRILGLELGADDYLAKPFEPRELQARIKALLRRLEPKLDGDEVLRFGRLEIDLAARVARLDGVSIRLSWLRMWRASASFSAVIVANPAGASGRLETRRRSKSTKASRSPPLSPSAMLFDASTPASAGWRAR